MKKTIKVTLLGMLTASIVLFSPFITTVNACTGIRLSGADKGIVYGRTMEWGAFDLHSRVTIGNSIIHIPLDQKKKQDLEDITPR